MHTTPQNNASPAMQGHQIFSGAIEVCAHLVKFSYWEFESELTDELKEDMEAEAEDRSKTCITQGYHSGELNYFNTANDEEIRGWWSIERQ